MPTKRHKYLFPLGENKQVDCRIDNDTAAVRDQVMDDNPGLDANDASRYLETLGAKHYRAGSRLTPDELDGRTS